MSLRAYNPAGLYRTEGVGVFCIQTCMLSFFFYGCAGSSLLHVDCSCSKWGLLSSSFGAEASHCGDFSRGAQARFMALGLKSCGAWA